MNHTSILYTKRYFPVIGEHGSDGVGYEDHVWFSFIIAEEYGRKIQVITERTYAFGNILLAIISLFVLKHIFNQFCSVKKSNTVLAIATPFVCHTPFRQHR